MNLLIEATLCILLDCILQDDTRSLQYQVANFYLTREENSANLCNHPRHFEVTVVPHLPGRVGRYASVVLRRLLETSVRK